MELAEGRACSLTQGGTRVYLALMVNHGSVTSEETEMSGAALKQDQVQHSVIVPHCLLTGDQLKKLRGLEPSSMHVQ